jgi:hypothetical protein
MSLYQYTEVTAGHFSSVMPLRNQRMGTPSILYYLKAILLSEIKESELFFERTILLGSSNLLLLFSLRTLILNFFSHDKTHFRKLDYHTVKISC